MKGTNELHLNEATMFEALEYWLNREVLTTGQRVTVVALEPTNEVVPMFRVYLDGEPVKKKKP